MKIYTSEGRLSAEAIRNGLTEQVNNGSYWLEISASDTDGFHVSGQIHNPVTKLGELISIDFDSLRYARQFVRSHARYLTKENSNV